MQHHKTICPVSFPFSSTIDDLELVELEFFKDINEGPKYSHLFGRSNYHLLVFLTMFYKKILD